MSVLWVRVSLSGRVRTHDFYLAGPAANAVDAVLGRHEHGLGFRV